MMLVWRLFRSKSLYGLSRRSRRTCISAYCRGFWRGQGYSEEQIEARIGEAARGVNVEGLYSKSSVTFGHKAC